MGTRIFFGCGKYGNKMRNCPTIPARERKGKKDPPSLLEDDAPKKNHFYALRARGSKSDKDVDDGSFLYFSFQCNEFLLCGEVCLALEWLSVDSYILLYSNLRVRKS